VCSRLTLFHLVDTQELAIQQMVRCLRPGGWLIDEDADWGTAVPVDPSHPRYAGYHDAWRDGDWWTVRGYDKVFGCRLPALFERCGLEDIHHEATTEVVRGGSPWARWWAVTLEIINELGGGGPVESYQRELDVITRALGRSDSLGPEGAAARVLGQAKPRRRITSANRYLHTATLVSGLRRNLPEAKIRFG
jgi:SAM-dependent methyltransferase